MATDGLVVRDGKTHSRSSSVTKLFPVTRRAALAWTGQSHIEGNPIAPHIRSVLSDVAQNQPLEQIAEAVSDGLNNLSAELDGTYTLAGYSDGNASIWSHAIRDGTLKNVASDWKSGISYTGEPYVVKRLLFPMWEKASESEAYSELPHSYVSWALFNMQDAIDFCLFAIRTTEVFLRFVPMNQSVGGAVDVACITEDGMQWFSTRTKGMWGGQDSIQLDGYYARRPLP